MDADQEVFKALDEGIDKVGLAGVIRILAGLCRGEAEAFMAFDPDSPEAKLWVTAEEAFRKLADTLPLQKAE
jgi:hypothetical protein